MKESLLDTDSKCNLLISQEYQVNFIDQLLEENNVLVSDEFSDEKIIEKDVDSDGEDIVKDDDYYGDMSELETSIYDNFWD